MKKNRFGFVSALKEHIISGKPITYLETQVIYGYSNLSPVLSNLKKQGWIIKSRKIPLPAAIRRVNKYAIYQPPENLPVNDIICTEWWVSN